MRPSKTIPDLKPGVAWFDDVSGAELASETRRLGGDAVLTAPPFRRHVAALLERME